MKRFKLPDNMSPTTEYFIKNIISQLKADNKIDDNDELSFYMLAEAMDDYVKAKADIAENGSIQKGDSGRRYVNPSCNLAHLAWSNIMSILKQYGLTKMSKGKIKYINNPNSQTDPLSEILNMDDE